MYLRSLSGRAWPYAGGRGGCDRCGVGGPRCGTFVRMNACPFPHLTHGRTWGQRNRIGFALLGHGLPTKKEILREPRRCSAGETPDGVQRRDRSAVYISRSVNNKTDGSVFYFIILIRSFVAVATTGEQAAR